LGSLASVVDVIPCHIEEDGLHRDGGELGRELDDVIQIDASGGVMILSFDKRSLDSVRYAQLMVLTKSINVHNGTVTLELAVEEVLQILNILGGDRQTQGCPVCSIRCGYAGLRLFNKTVGMVDKSERTGRVASCGMRASNSQRPERMLDKLRK
jgi:hypothetical protein